MMPRISSRHNSHKSSEKNKERWDVLPEPLEKRGNAGEVSVKKGIERDEDESGFVSDRWMGDGNVEGVDVKVDMKTVVEKIEKLKSSQSKSIYGSSKKRERGEEGRQEEHEKKRDEKVLARRENSGGNDSNGNGRESGLGRIKDCGQFKERGRGDIKKERGVDLEKKEDRGKEYVLNKEKEPEKVTDFLHRNSQTGRANGKFPLKGDTDNNERYSQNGHSKEVHYKDLGKQTRRDGSAEKYKCIGSVTDNSERKLNSDDRRRNAAYKELRYKDEKYRENYQEDSGRDQKYRDEKRHGSVRSENKYGTDSQIPKMHNGSRVNGINHESSLTNHEKDSASFLHIYEDREKTNNRKLDIDQDIRLDSFHSGRVDSTNRQNYQKKPLLSNLPVVVKDEERSQSKERHHTSSASSGDLAGVSGATGRSLNSKSVESVVKRKDVVQQDNIKVEEHSFSRYYARSDGHTSAINSTEKMTTHLDQHYSRKRSGSRGYDCEEPLQKRSYSKDGREPPDDGPTCAVDSLASTRPDHFPGSSPGHILQHMPIRCGADVSVLGSFEENNRNQCVDRNSNNQYRRNGGQPNTWKGNWPSQNGNRFVGYPHGPSPGYPPAVHPFSSPSMFGVRPFMEMNHPVPFQMSDNHFAWQNPSDSCPPHFQGWHGRAGWDQSRHFIGGNRGWDVDRKFLNDQKEVFESQKSEFLISQNEHSQIKPTQEDSSERKHAGGQLLRDDQNQSKLNETPHRNDSDSKACIESLDKCCAEMSSNKRLKISENVTSNDNDADADFYKTYLSKLNPSVGLAGPELYKKFIATVAARDVTSKDSKLGTNTTIRSHIEDKKIIFSPLSEDFFKENIHLYNKIIKGSNVNFSSSIAYSHQSAVKKETNQEVRYASDEDTMSNVTALEGKTNEISGKEHDQISDVDSQKSLSDKGTIEVATAHEEKISENSRKEPEQVPEVDSQKSLSNEGTIEVATAHKEKPDIIPSDVILSVESSLGCGDLKPVCLSRIHHSPKSTH